MSVRVRVRVGRVHEEAPQAHLLDERFAGVVVEVVAEDEPRHHGREEEEVEHRRDERGHGVVDEHHW